MKIALIGNPNSGKTTLFNGLTKGNQKVGNYTGVTVEKKTGKYYKDKSVEIVDLPGVYSLNPYSLEERITSEFLKSNNVDVIINIIDSTNLERNLNLTLQALSLNIPTVLALNMSDELRSNGTVLNLDEIKAALKAECILVSALKNKNIHELIKKAKDISGTAINYGFEYHGEDEEQNHNARKEYITSVIEKFRTKGESKSQKITDKIDKIVTNKWLAFPIFAAVIFLMYFVSIQTIGALSIDFMGYLIGDLLGGGIESLLISMQASAWVISLVVDGIIGGVGAVIGFIPQILILFLFISFLEGCGYMARVAFIMDRLFKKIGLSGKSFIPMIIGCGCSVPAIMSTKTIENDLDRKTTILLTPFIPCSAKLPVFALIAGAVFPGNALVAPSMYFLGIFMVIICGLIINKIRNKRGTADTFVMEMPKYRLPAAKNIIIELWEKAKSFFIKAGTIIFVASIILWFLKSFSFTFKMVDVEYSMLALIGKVISPIFYPLGFGNWQSTVAVITGFFAKETVVSTFGVLFGEGNLSEQLSTFFTPQAAYSFMAFTLLAAPCFAAIGATRKEMGNAKWTWIAVGFQTATAYIVALIINQAGNLWAFNKGIFTTIIVCAAVLSVLYFSIKSIIKNKKCGSCAGCSSCKGCKKSKNDVQLNMESKREISNLTNVHAELPTNNKANVKSD